MAKAFDRVWQRVLLAKFPSYGLPEFMQVDSQLSHWAQHQSRYRRFLLQTYARERWRSPKLRAIPYAVSSAYQ